MSAAIPQLRVGQRVVVEAASALMKPMQLHVSAVTPSAIGLSLARPSRILLPTGERLRMSGTDASGQWTLHAQVTSPLYPGQTRFEVGALRMEENVQRRGEQRVRLQMPLRIRPAATCPAEFIARSEDLSLGGVGFESPHALIPGALIAIVFSLDTGRTLSVPATVVRCMESARSQGRFLVGAQFLKLSAILRTALERYLRDKRRELD